MTDLIDPRSFKKSRLAPVPVRTVPGTRRKQLRTSDLWAYTKELLSQGGLPEYKDKKEGQYPF
jgi:hypothetical protein